MVEIKKPIEVGYKGKRYAIRVSPWALAFVDEWFGTPRSHGGMRTMIAEFSIAVGGPSDFAEAVEWFSDSERGVNVSGLFMCAVVWRLAKAKKGKRIQAQQDAQRGDDNANN